MNSPNLWLIFTRRGVDIEQYPAIKAHLQQWKAQLMPGVVGGRKAGKYAWFEIQDTVAYYKELEEPYIAWGNLATAPQFTFIPAGNFLSAPASFLISDSKYLLAVLNSAMTRYLVSQSAAVRAGGFLEYKPMYVSPLAIPNAAPEQQQVLADKVEAILALKAADAGADTTSIEREIDDLVADLYGLDEAERALIGLV